MQKVYLLLRNNQQTGPHSLEELLQLDLKAFDLIWVEGKSYGWSYPTEVDTLKPFVTDSSSQNIESIRVQPVEGKDPSTADKTTKKVFVSLPVATVLGSVPFSSPSTTDTIEQKAEELRKRAQAYTPQNPSQSDPVKTNYTRNLTDVEEDYTSWIYQKKTKKKNLLAGKSWMVIGLVAITLTGGWWVGKAVYSRPEQNVAKIATAGTQKELTADIAAQPAAEESPKATDYTVPALKKNTATKTNPQPKKSNSLSQSSVTKTIAAQPESTQQKRLPPQQEETAPITMEEPTETVVSEKPKEKKKNLKELLGGLFKKNKKDEAVKEAPKPADNSNNERKATRRDEETSSGQGTIDLSSQVVIKTNKNNDEWMMGVQGLKLTIFNRGTVTIKEASVEVSYYSEQDDLLQKKTLHFSNIAAGKSQTVAAADHRMADHVEHKLISATGTDAYVKQ